MENVYIIQPMTGSDKDEILHAEAVALIESAGAEYAGTMRAKIREIDPATYLGKGKTEELPKPGETSARKDMLCLKSWKFCGIRRLWTKT